MHTARPSSPGAAGEGVGLETWRECPLFPLGTVLFPDGRLPLKVFEARYIDLIGHCLRSGQPFGVVTLLQGGEVRQTQEDARFAEVGCLARVLDCDSQQPGILNLLCRGEHRFLWRQARQRPDGLWLADILEQPADAEQPPDAKQAACVAALERAIAALAERGQTPFLPPHHLGDAGWVANRWCELLPIGLAARHRLMALPDARTRLSLVEDFLRRHQIVTD